MPNAIPYTSLMKRFLYLSAFALLAGCAGNGNGLSPARFAGTWQGTWVNTADSSDAGTSTWTISPSGVVTGQDFDPGRGTTFDVVGNIDATGRFTSHSTPTGGEPASLNGNLAFNNDRILTGILEWGVAPPLTYTYGFHRMP